MRKTTLFIPFIAAIALAGCTQMNPQEQSKIDQANSTAMQAKQEADAAMQEANRAEQKCSRMFQQSQMK